MESSSCVGWSVCFSVEKQRNSDFFLNVCYTVFSRFVVLNVPSKACSLFVT